VFVADRVLKTRHEDREAPRKVILAKRAIEAVGLTFEFREERAQCTRGGCRSTDRRQLCEADVDDRLTRGDESAVPEASLGRA
jgi:hypothetical protein